MVSLHNSRVEMSTNIKSQDFGNRTYSADARQSPDLQIKLRDNGFIKNIVVLLKVC